MAGKSKMKKKKIGAWLQNTIYKLYNCPFLIFSFENLDYDDNEIWHYNVRPRTPLNKLLYKYDNK